MAESWRSIMTACLTRSAAAFAAAWLLFACVGRSPAQEAAGGVLEPEIPTIRLTLHGAREPRPALKYRLLPAHAERKPGNAAQFYYRALVLHNQPAHADRQRQETELYEAWEERPDDPETFAITKQWLAHFPQAAAAELREATYREHCNFDFRIRELRGMPVISFLLPEIQEMRRFGRYYSFKARVEIAEGKYDEALESLRQGYQLAANTGGEPLIINGLVGIAIASIMNGEVERWIGSPDSPNLYWAIAALPHPLVDLRPALEHESRMPELVVPFLADAETAQRKPEQWQQLLSQTLRDMQSLHGSSADESPLAKLQSDVAVAGIVMQHYPNAKRELLEQGFDKEALEAMPVAQVVIIYASRLFREIGDEFAKGIYLPIPEREAYYARLNLREQGMLGPGSREPFPLASLLLPAVGAAMAAQTRSERDRAALQVLEAIRAHVAETGELPKTLGDITVLPVPNNPATGEPFPYRLDEVAVLELPAPKHNPSPQFAKRYELTLAKPQ
jgi:hypothetical protein